MSGFRRGSRAGVFVPRRPPRPPAAPRTCSAVVPAPPPARPAPNKKMIRTQADTDTRRYGHKQQLFMRHGHKQQLFMRHGHKQQLFIVEPARPAPTMDLAHAGGQPCPVSTRACLLVRGARGPPRGRKVSGMDCADADRCLVRDQRYGTDQGFHHAQGSGMDCAYADRCRPPSRGRNTASGGQSIASEHMPPSVSRAEHSEHCADSRRPCSHGFTRGTPKSSGYASGERRAAGQAAVPRTPTAYGSAAHTHGIRQCSAHPRQSAV